MPVYSLGQQCIIVNIHRIVNIFINSAVNINILFCFATYPADIQCKKIILQNNKKLLTRIILIIIMIKHDKLIMIKIFI